jgi:uncharacterized membrane protein
LKTRRAEKLWQTIDTAASLGLIVLMFGGLLFGLIFWYTNPRVGFLLTLAAVLAAPFVLHRHLRSRE